MQETEQRHHERVQYFMVQESNHNLIPIWVFTPADDPDLSAGLVLDISNGGIQILTSAKTPIAPGARYRIRFLALDSQEADSNLPDLELTQIWSRPEGRLYLRHGFEFSNGSDIDLTPFAERLQASELQILRCTIKAV